MKVSSNVQKEIKKQYDYEKDSYGFGNDVRPSGNIDGGPKGAERLCR
jgi:hypothetical protein